MELRGKYNQSKIILMAKIAARNKVASEMAEATKLSIDGFIDKKFIDRLSAAEKELQIANQECHKCFSDGLAKGIFKESEGLHLL